MEKDRETTTIRVPSEGGEPKDGDTPMQTPGPNPALDDKKPEMVIYFPTSLSLRRLTTLYVHSQSAEDRELSERLDLAVERLRDTNADVQRLALELLRTEVRGATRCA